MSDMLKSEERILARGLARDLSVEEMEAVGGGRQIETISGPTWITPNGDVVVGADG